MSGEGRDRGAPVVPRSQTGNRFLAGPGSLDVLQLRV